LNLLLAACGERVTGISPPVKQTARQPRFED
jgi:hypothetical protein